MQAREARGMWWLPEHPNDRVAGTLSFKPGQPLGLRTIGSFQSQVDPTPEGTIILGRTSEGDVTLYRCGGSDLLPGLQGSIPPEISGQFFHEVTYQAQIALFGHHFERPQDLAFTNLRISFSNIEDWTIGGRFGGPVEAESRPACWYDPLPDLVAATDAFQITLRDAVAQPCSLHREARLARAPHFRVECAIPVALDEFLNGPVLALQTLVAFGLGIPVATKWLETIIGEGATKRTIDIVFMADEPPEQPIRHLIESLFTLADVADQFEVVLQRWFALPKRIAPVLDLYFAALYHQPGMRPNHDFLSLAQALETYHRETYGGEHLPVDTFKNAKAAFSASLPDTLDAAIRKTALDKIDNVITLAARVEQLLDHAPPAIIQRAIPDRERFAKQLRHTRNYFTHWGKPSPKWVAIGIELVNLTEAARWLLEGLLLGELGLRADQIEQLLDRNERLKRVGQWSPVW